MDRRKRIIRTGFDEDFTIFYAELTYESSENEPESEQVEWSSSPESTKRIFRVNTIVALSLISCLVGLLAVFK